MSLKMSIGRTLEFQSQAQNSISCRPISTRSLQAEGQEKIVSYR